jgi:hypothetical protein
MPRSARHDRTFAIASRDELWLNGARVESRLSHGVAQDTPDRILASDDFDEELVHLCDESIAELRKSVADDARMRLVTSARRVRETIIREATITTTIDGVSIVGGDVAALRAILRTERRDEWRGQSILWSNGSASVLLHEAIGHAAEHEAPPVAWPAWLSVRDEPPFAVDDCGHDARVVDLMHEPPSCMRRESFRDVPLRRMTNVIARGNHELEPDDFVEVFLVAGGSYDPLTDLVTINVSVSTAGAFTLRKTRAEIAASIAGASGEPIRYPGVICSREGQELAVGSSAPVMVTR